MSELHAARERHKTNMWRESRKQREQKEREQRERERERDVCSLNVLIPFK